MVLRLRRGGKRRGANLNDATAVVAWNLARALEVSFRRSALGIGPEKYGDGTCTVAERYLDTVGAIAGVAEFLKRLLGSCGA